MRCAWLQSKNNYRMGCDVNFTPTKELLDLQKAELDILKEFQRVCDKHNIIYYAEGGTHLGAARHKGFIPWDDDIDIQMTWDNYKKLKEVAEKEFNEPYVFQDYTTHRFYDISPMARVRNSLTTGCTKWEFENVQDSSYNRGIFIDIWVLFPIPPMEYRDERKQTIDGLWRAIRGWYAWQSEQIGKSSPYSKYIPCWQEASKENTITDLKDKYIEACNWEGDYEELGMTSFRTFNPSFMWNKDWFNESVLLPFEDTTIRCPKMFKEILTKSYGDWSVPVFDGSIHEMVVCDINTPYYENEALHLN